MTLDLLKDCQLCPRRCGVDRTKRAGFCGAGTIFFSHCNLKCVYCQNFEISHGGRAMNFYDS